MKENYWEEKKRHNGMEILRRIINEIKKLNFDSLAPSCERS
jgi:5-methylthioribose kinase